MSTAKPAFQRVPLPFVPASQRSRHRISRAAAAKSEAAPASDVSKGVSDAVATLKSATNDSTLPPPKAVFKALRTVQKAKLKILMRKDLQEEGWSETIGCNSFWRLVFTADKNSVQKSMKDEEAGSGTFFPILAGQIFDLNAGEEGRFQNGVFLPHIASLLFRGSYTMKAGQKKLEFIIDQVIVKLGPLTLGPFKVKVPSKPPNPFFLFFYADDDIICAQGKGGGIAMWTKASPAFLLKKGIA